MNLVVNFLVFVAKVKELSAIFKNIFLCLGFKTRISEVTNVLWEEVPVRSGPEAELSPGDIQFLKDKPQVFFIVWARVAHDRCLEHLVKVDDRFAIP